MITGVRGVYERVRDRVLPACPRKRLAVLLSGAGALTGGPLVLLLFVSGPLSAGDSASSQAGITLNLIDDLSVTEQEPLAFPSVVQGETDAV